MDPPRLPTWLLGCLDASCDPLVGDLYEEWRRGRSVGWFWRQSAGVLLRRAGEIRRRAGKIRRRRPSKNVRVGMISALVAFVIAFVTTFLM